MVIKVIWKTYEEDPLAFFLPNPIVQTDTHPYFMGRIVNVKRFLEKYPFSKPSENPIILHLSDSICHWNNRTFFYRWDIKISKRKGVLYEFSFERIKNGNWYSNISIIRI
jgi:predicted acetyltransferase